MKGENAMRDEYDFSEGIKNPYTRPQKSTITIRLDKVTVDYFKKMSEEICIPYQTLINVYLTDCATKGRRLNLSWSD